MIDLIFNYVKAELDYVMTLNDMNNPEDDLFQDVMIIIIEDKLIGNSQAH